MVPLDGGQDRARQQFHQVQGGCQWITVIFGDGLEWHWMCVRLRNKCEMVSPNSWSYSYRCRVTCRSNLGGEHLPNNSHHPSWASPTFIQRTTKHKTTMIPPCDPTVLECNPQFKKLYQQLTTTQLNADGSTRAKDAQPARRAVLEVCLLPCTYNKEAQRPCTIVAEF